MEFTGERFVPIKDLMSDEMAFEHLHRYYSVQELVKGKVVLDIACGEGYGTDILSRNAKKVIGIDIDKATIEHANKVYQKENTEFICGTVVDIPLDDNSVDFIISFETIEHINETDQKKFMAEVKRILRKDGILIISTPDKANYTERYSHKNEFHIKEFDKEEFFSFLKESFSNTIEFFQGYEIVGAITENSPDEIRKLGIVNWPRAINPFNRKYLIAVCSDVKPDNISLSSVVFQVHRNYLETMDRIVDNEKHIVELGSWGKSLDKEIQEKNKFISDLGQEKSALRESEAYFKELVNKQAVSIENFSHLEKERGQAMADLERKLNQKISEVEELHKFNSHAEKNIAEKNIMVANQSETIIFLKKKIEEYSNNIQQLEQESNDKEELVRQLKEKENVLYVQLENSNQRLNDIYVSEGWKLLSFYYKLKGKVLPEHSKRYKFLKKTFNKIRGKNEFNSSVAEEMAHLNPYVKISEAPDSSLSYGTIEFTNYLTPTVSIIIPVYNGWDMTYKCLKSIHENTTGVTYEIIIADDGATDETKNISNYIKNIVLVKNETNLGFLANCNNASKSAKGSFILFLNNDTEVRPGWLSSLTELMNRDKSIGMTGSKFIYPDGRLQEAGGIIWNDASAWNFGHRQFPDSPEFNYVKEVDYISGACLLIKKELWEEIGGFDARYAPAYCEDSDLAFEVRKRGFKLVFQPLSEIIHHEGYSHGVDETGNTTKAYQKLNNQKLRDKWNEVLLRDHFPNGENVFWARDRSRYKKTILVVDHYVPHYDKDAGSKTVFQYLKLFVSMNLNVKFIGDNFFRHEPYTTTLQQMGIEVLYGSWYAENWKQWIKNNGDKFDFVLLNRPHITIKYIDFIKETTKAKIFYYGHDLHFVREKKQYEVQKDKKLLTSAEEWEKKEKYIFSVSDIVLAPSNEEAGIINSELEEKKAFSILPYFFEIDPLPVRIADFSGRKDILFVGGFTHKPNVDGVLWFCKDVFPKVKEQIPGIKLKVIGSNPPKEISDLASPDIEIKGFLTEEQLDMQYANSRVSIIPLRYGAGVKGKTVEALYKGIPLVTTSFGIEGLPGQYPFISPWDKADEFAKELTRLYLSSDDELARVSKLEINYIRDNFSQTTARQTITQLFKL